MSSSPCRRTFGRRRQAHAALCMALIVALLTGFAGAAGAFSLEKEIALGKELAAEVEKEMPLSKNEQWQKEMADMGARLVPLVSRKEIPYTFRVIDAKSELNAFALPGGYIYFTERMWRVMNLDERAAVMAHEIIHSDRRHGVNAVLKAQQRTLWMLPLMLLTGGGAAYAMQVGDLVISQRYSRKMEREADEMGIELAAKAGYNPAGAVTSMLKLLHMNSDENHYEISSVFLSHPETEKRIAYLSEEAVRLGAQPSDFELHSVDDPGRLGNVTSKTGDSRLIYAQASSSLEYAQKVEIRQMLWNESAGAITPQPVAVATVLVPGRYPVLVIPDDKDFTFDDILKGDGLYPAPAEPGPEAPPEAGEAAAPEG